MLSRQQILEAEDRPTVTVEVPEWGGSVCIRSMSGAERDSFEKQFMDEKASNIRAQFLVKCLVDDDGNRIFSDKEAAALGNKSGAVLTRLFEEASRLNHLSADDVEELAGNSEATQSDDSTSP